MKKLSALLLTALLIAGVPVAAETTFQGDVIRILDGDTVEVLTSTKQTYRVRLANIDAPEKKQPFGEKARQALASMAYQQTVQVVDRGGDRYGRRIGVLMVGGRDLNAEMIRQGFAWVYDRYNSDKTLPALQHLAKAARAGLWADTAPIAPWEFRRAR